MTYMHSKEKLLLNLQEQLNNRKYISNKNHIDEEELFLYLGKGYSFMNYSMKSLKQKVRFNNIKKFYIPKKKHM